MLTRFEGNEVMNFSPLDLRLRAENIAITGAGTFDGQAERRTGGRGKAGPAGDANQAKDTAALRQMGEDNVPASERVFGDGH